MSGSQHSTALPPALPCDLVTGHPRTASTRLLNERHACGPHLCLVMTTTYTHLCAVHHSNSITLPDLLDLKPRQGAFRPAGLTTSHLAVVQAVGPLAFLVLLNDTQMPRIRR